MISKCRSRATDGGCVLKMKLLRWPRARERRRRRRGRDCSREGKENRKVVLRLSGWARCVPCQELISDLTIGSEEEEARMFRADQLLPTLLSGSVKNEVESVDKETLPMEIKCFPK